MADNNVADLRNLITEQGDLVRKLKAQGADKFEVSTLYNYKHAIETIPLGLHYIIQL